MILDHPHLDSKQNGILREAQIDLPVWLGDFSLAYQDCHPRFQHVVGTLSQLVLISHFEFTKDPESEQKYVDSLANCKYVLEQYVSVLAANQTLRERELAPDAQVPAGNVMVHLNDIGVYEN